MLSGKQICMFTFQKKPWADRQMIAEYAEVYVMQYFTQNFV